ncbi:MAG: DUF1990 family protein [Nocardioides sp.]
MNRCALSLPEAEQLRGADFSYDEVGCTRGGLAPNRYRSLRRSREIGIGSECFDVATAVLLSWGMHRRARLRVRASSEQVVEGAVAMLSVGPGVLSVRAPVRVVYVVDEPRRKGFAYGTLPGHPESGEEAFVVERHDDGRVTITITAFSRPASRLARLAGPVGHGLQRWVTHRYLRSL